MENKKLLKYLLKDLIELDEMFAEEGKSSFDEMEMEFIRNRVSGAKKLVKLYLDKNESKPKISSEPVVEKVPEAVEKESEEIEVESVKKNKIVEPDLNKEDKNAVIEENKAESKPVEVTQPIKVQEEAPLNNKQVEVVEEIEPEHKIKEEKEVVVETVEEEVVAQIEKAEEKEVQLEEEELIEQKNKRLGDSFSKEKSVNDLMSDDSSKLEHKLSNRPVLNIKTSIGINDKFQYIRELFEGSAEDFTKAVDELDALDNLKDAVQYLQNNYKWKKNDTSLKFVNLIKRRFPNE